MFLIADNIIVYVEKSSRINKLRYTRVQHGLDMRSMYKH